MIEDTPSCSMLWPARVEVIGLGGPAARLIVTDEELRQVGDVIHPNNMLKTATKYLGLTVSDAEGTPFEVLKRWKYRDAFGGEKKVCLNLSFLIITKNHR